MRLHNALVGDGSLPERPLRAFFLASPHWRGSLAFPLSSR
jgi:hypothetical protein